MPNYTPIQTVNYYTQLSNLLAEVEYNGLYVDKLVMGEVSNQLTEQVESARQDLITMAEPAMPMETKRKITAKKVFNPASPLQVKDVLKYFDVEPPISPKTKKPSTDEEALNKIIEYPKQLPNDQLVRDFCEKLLEYRGLAKLNSTYVEGTIKRLHDSKIHPTFSIHTTTTGRLSCRNPNVQNIPRNSPIKQLFTARAEDRILVHSDYSQAELRVVSWLAGDNYFRDIFLREVDPFDMLTPELFDGTTRDQHTKESWKEIRTIVKTFVYGLNYGRTEYGIARGLKISVEDARKYKEKFFSVIPDIIKWQEWVKAEVKAGNDLVTPFGRHRRYNLITKQNERNVMNEALAFLPQSTASDMTLHAAIEVQDYFKKHANDFTEPPLIINLIHDDIMVDCHASDKDTVLDLLTDAMERAGDSLTDGYVPMATGASDPSAICYDYRWSNLT